MRTYRSLVVSQRFGPALRNHRHIDVGTRAQIVKHTRPDRASDEVDGFLALQLSACKPHRSTA
jgi:hypothetical protein